MRIRELEIPAYGLFTDHEPMEIPEGLVVVAGANEEGKSTLFSLLTTLLYGFYPVSDFPYRPWHVNRYPELRAVLSLQDGSTVEVWRKLTSTPTGRLTVGKHTSELGNHDLPFVEHVSMGLYKGLYALTQADMRSLEEAQRQEVEDRLLTGLGAQVLRPTRDAIGELGDRAQRLWRSDRRGNPRYKELQELYRSARHKRNEAKERDEAVRGKAKRLHEVQTELEQLERSLAKLNAQIRRAEVLVPVRKRLQQLDDWNSEIPEISAVEQLPEGLSTERQRLSDRVESAKKDVGDLERDRAALVKVQNKFTDEDRSILKHSDRLEAWLRRMSAHEQERGNLAELRRKERQLGNSVADAAQSLLAGPWEDEYAARLKQIASPDLKRRTDQFQEAQTEVQRLQGTADNVGPVRVVGELPRRFIVGTILVGVILLVVGILAATPFMWIAGIMVAVIGGVGAAFSLHVRHERAVREDERRKEVEQRKRQEQQAREALEKARERVKKVLGDLPVAQALVERPDPALYEAIERLRSLCSQRRQTTEDMQERQKQWDEAQRDLQELVEALGEPEATAEAVSRLEQRLNTARKRRYDCESATERVEQIDGTLRPARDALSEAEGAYDRFMGAVAQVVGQGLEPEDALQRAAGLQALARRIRDAEQQLEADHPDLEQLKEEIQRLESSQKETWVLDPEEVELSRKKSETLNEEWKTLTEEKVNLSKDIDDARAEISIGELDGEIARIEEEMEDVCRERDRLALLATILREAEGRFREEHQPDVLKRASEYLARITAGRYKRLITLEDSQADERLAVITESGEPRHVEFPLSGGTLDQILLAFRLAVIDHLDEAHESLPLVLDEALINWDDVRFEKTAELLSEVARRRQVFLFTCHDWMLERLLEVPGASVVRLA